MKLQILSGLIVIAGTGAGLGESLGPVQVLHSIRNDATPELRSMTLIQPQKRTEWENEEIPNQFGELIRVGDQNLLEHQGPDPVLQSHFGATNVNVPLVNFEGVGNIQSVYPPDPNGDVGLHHYIQMVNSSFAIYGKSGNLLYGPADNSTLWQGFVGPWTGRNDGDPIVLYDPIADRWLTSQFAIPNASNGPYYELIAISQSGDPLGAWNRYAFEFTDFPDYPKIGVWPDGYYLSVVSFVSGSTFAGPGVAVMDRSAMLLGNPATMQFIQLPTSETRLLPCDLDGPAPSAGTPNYFMSAKDNLFSGGVDRLGIYEFHVDWADAGNTTFTGPSNLSTAAFDMNMCGLSRNCIPQPATSQGLDALSDRLLYRLQYRNFGTYQTLLANHTVDVDGTDRAGIRWYELRNGGSGWSISQQGTYSPDATNRWMGSIAMNGAGDIALGFSAASSSVFPSIRYTGRMDGDPSGQMTIAEQTIISGSGSQTGTAHRWGDYTMMAVDPVDDQTFWYTNEYVAATGSVSWQTRIASFGLTASAVPALAYISTTISGGNGNGTIDLNECNNLDVTIHNEGGASATGVSAMLETSTTGVTIAQGSATFPNISSGASAMTETAFQISTAPDFACGTPIVLNLTVAYSGGGSDMFPITLPTCECPTTTESGSITAGDQHQTDRIPRSGIASSCASPKVCPGTFIIGSLAYDAYPFTNIQPTTQCYTVTVQQNCSGGKQILCSAYSGTFDPANICTNYLADMGTSSPNTSMSFSVTSGATFVVVVSEVDTNAGCSSYTLNVTAGNCAVDGGGQCAPLPIQLSSWSATTMGGGNVGLTWSTLTEVNNYGFEIQKSPGAGADFQSLPGVFVPGNGTTNVPHHYSYVDSAGGQGAIHYRLKQIDLDGTAHISDVVMVDATTDVRNRNLPGELSLEQNFPNPFNPSTVIRYALPQGSDVRLEIVNTLGQLVALPVHESQQAGYHEVTFENRGLSSGVYFYRLEVGGKMLTRRMILIR